MTALFSMWSQPPLQSVLAVKVSTYWCFSFSLSLEVLALMQIAKSGETAFSSVEDLKSEDGTEVWNLVFSQSSSFYLFPIILDSIPVAANSWCSFSLVMEEFIIHETGIFCPSGFSVCGPLQPGSVIAVWIFYTRI